MGDVIIDGLTGANRLVVLDANGKIPALDGSAVTAIAGANFSTGTIPVARIDTGTTAGKVVKLDGNAKLPAVSGAALTGVVGATKNASDPTISTNPSGGVGTEWHNTTSGNVFVCTDATAGENVWTNVGGHSGDIALFHGAGESYGYSVGRQSSSDIEKYSFTSDSDSVDVANLLYSRYYGAGGGSDTHGYEFGGYAYFDTISKHQFGTTNDATDVGNLSANKGAIGNTATFSETYVYCTGGNTPQVNVIEKIAFSADGDAIDVGDLTVTTSWHTNATSSDYGWTAGNDPSPKDWIQKFPFASDTDATDVANLATGRGELVGGQSSTHGYAGGGCCNPSIDVIDKWSFSSGADATQVGTIGFGTGSTMGGSSAEAYGYYHGGMYPNSSEDIQKYSFTTDGNTVDVADLAIKGTGGGAEHASYHV